MRATWFNQGYLARTLAPGTPLVLTGTVGKYKGLALKNPELEILAGEETDRLHVGRIVPMYSLTEGVSQRVMREWVWQALEGVAEPGIKLPDWVPCRSAFAAGADALRKFHGLINAQMGRVRIGPQGVQHQHFQIAQPGERICRYLAAIRAISEAAEAKPQHRHRAVHHRNRDNQCTGNLERGAVNWNEFELGSAVG